MSCLNCNKIQNFESEELYTWCTDCGNYGIYAAVKRALVAEGKEPHEVLLCFDIGCNGNGADKIGGYRFKGLHGRVIPFASGAALANERLTVFAHGGDGGTLSEGIGHLIHAIRANYKMVFVLHNNSNYGLTTGQASATTPKNIEMNSSPEGVISEPLHVMELVLGLKPSFAARTFSGDIHQMTEVFRRAMQHQGFAFVEVLQACPTYNKVTPHEWYLERVYDVAKTPDYNASSLDQAKAFCLDLDNRIATGVLYQDAGSIPYHKRLQNRAQKQTALVDEVKGFDVQPFLQQFI